MKVFRCEDRRQRLGEAIICSSAKLKKSQNMQRNRNASVIQKNKINVQKNIPEETWTLELLGKYFKTIILNIFNELKKKNTKRWKQSEWQYMYKMRISTKRQKLQKKTRNFEAENTINELKNSLKVFKRR